MKTKLVHILSLLLAALLQVAPLVRSILPNAQGLAPNAWGFILKIGIGTAALIGFDSVSRASGISISPPNATVGQPYVGTVTYSGSHAGAVSSMSYLGTCLGSPTPFVDGLTIQYSGANTATVSGTPTNSGSYTFGITAWDHSNCPGTGQSDSKRTTTLLVASASTATNLPIIAATPQNTCAQVGSDVQLSGGATGYPVPRYQWWTASGTPIPGATNSILTLTNVHLTDANIYTMTASNVVNTGNSFNLLPKANCYLSVCITGGTNFTAFDYTNYAPAGVPLTLFSWLTNGYSSTTNYYLWNVNSTTISTSNTAVISASSLTPTKSGTYTVFLSSTNAGVGIVNNQNYDSYWQFGYLPLCTNTLPAATNLNPGDNITFSVGIRGNLNVHYIGGAGGAGFVTNADPCVFWYQDSNLVASQIYTNSPTSSATYTSSVVTASLSLSNVAAANAGNYTVVATNLWGSVTNSVTALSVSGGGGSAPGFATQPPANIPLLAGQSAAISCTVTGTPPLAYQWLLGGGTISDGGVYSGTMTNTLTLTGVTTNNGGNYTLAVNNSSGAMTSSVALVNIALPPSVAARALGAGNIQINGNTLTGLNYVVESATNLSSLAWLPVQTNNTGVSGNINFQTNTTGNPINFYRILFP